MKDSLVLYTAYNDKFKNLTDAQFGQLMRIIMRYQEDGVIPEIEDAAVSISFDVIKYDIDKNTKKYEETVEKRREAGKKGGQKANQEESKVTDYKQMQANASKCKQVSANQADNDNVNDNDNDNDTVSFKKRNNNKAARSTFSEDKQLDAAIRDFTEHRRKLRKPMTDKAVKLFMARLEKICPNNIPGQVELINTAIERGWQTVYPPNGAETIKSPESDSKLDALADTWLEKVGGD